MKSGLRVAPWVVIALAAALTVAGCKSSSDQTAASTDPTQDQNMSQDPADANLAPASDTTAGTVPASTPAPAPKAAAPVARPAPAPAAPATAPVSDASYESNPEDIGEEPVAQAQQPPPPLPEYSQPPCPGEGYIWTPGYWSYHPTGYYWVPGVWTQAPYVGALWTPPYWGFNRGVYVLFPGHWGRHIGFYGGINYGFGYTGVGYHGGYWNGDRFAYNRTVNNVNTTVIKNVYTYNVVNINKTTIVNNRVSYNGGAAGVRAHPEQREIVTVREPRAPVMASQVRHQEEARADHQQFVVENHGKPARPVIEHPLPADRDVHPVQRQLPPQMHPLPPGHVPNAPVIMPGEKHPPQHTAHPDEKHPEDKHHPDHK